MPQVFQVQVFISRNQFAAVDMESVYQVVEEVLRHGTVVHKAADISYFALFHLGLHLFYDFGSIGGIVYQYIRIARNLDTITAVHIITGKDHIQIGLDDIFDEHQVIVVPHFGQFDETGYFAVGLLHYEVLRTSGSTGRQSFQVKAYGQIQAIISQERDYLIFGNRYGLQEREDFFPEKRRTKSR